MKIKLLAYLAFVSVAQTANAQTDYSMDEAQFATKLYQLRVAHEMCGLSTNYLGDFDTRLDRFLNSHHDGRRTLGQKWGSEKPFFEIEVGTTLLKGEKSRACAQMKRQTSSPAFKKALNDTLGWLDNAHRKSRAH